MCLDKHEGRYRKLYRNKHSNCKFPCDSGVSLRYGSGSSCLLQNPGPARQVWGTSDKTSEKPIWIPIQNPGLAPAIL